MKFSLYSMTHVLVRDAEELSWTSVLLFYLSFFRREGTQVETRKWSQDARAEAVRRARHPNTW